MGIFYSEGLILSGVIIYNFVLAPNYYLNNYIINNDAS
jgi:hypothetical protein